MSANQAANAARPDQAPTANVARQAIFSLTPARANPDAYLDYTTTNASKIFKQASAPLDYKFDCEESSVQTFIETLRDRSTSSGWDSNQASIININGTNLFDEYGLLTLDQIRAHVITYVATETRTAQNSYQMYLSIISSLTDEGRAKLLTRSEDYTVNNIQSGPLLFKVLMTITTVDTRATVTFIRTNMSNLDSYMATVKDDVLKFNQYVRKLRNDLSSRGETSNDLLINIFKGYLACSDRQFIQYIRQKKDIYDEGGEVTIDTLMNDAQNKYKNLVLEQQWNSLSPEEEKLIALTARFEELKDKNLKLSKNLTRPKPKPNSYDKKSKPKSKKQIDKNYAWKKIPPKSGQSQVLKRDSKTYYWCPEHLAWCIHKPNECHLKKEREANAKESEDKPAKEKGTSAVTFSALEAILSE